LASNRATPKIAKGGHSWALPGACSKPDVLVLLGATAAQSIWGPQFRITKERGVVKTGELAQAILATIHPSAVLRAPDDDARHQLFQTLVDDLRLVARLLEGGNRPRPVDRADFDGDDMPRLPTNFGPTR
jgi:hypothetical protein